MTRRRKFVSKNDSKIPQTCPICTSRYPSTNKSAQIFPERVHPPKVSRCTGITVYVKFLKNDHGKNASDHPHTLPQWFIDVNEHKIPFKRILTRVQAFIHQKSKCFFSRETQIRTCTKLRIDVILKIYRQGTGPITFRIILRESYRIRITFIV